MAKLTDCEREQLLALLKKAEDRYAQLITEPEVTAFSHSNTNGGRSVSMAQTDRRELERDIERWRKALGLCPSVLFESRQLRPVAIANC